MSFLVAAWTARQGKSALLQTFPPRINRKVFLEGSDEERSQANHTLLYHRGRGSCGDAKILNGSEIRRRIAASKKTPATVVALRIPAARPSIQASHSASRTPIEANAATMHFFSPALS